MIRCIFIFHIYLIPLWWKEVDSFSTIPANSNCFPSLLEREQLCTVVDSLDLRIRSTRESDVHQGISDIWAKAISGDFKHEPCLPKALSFRRKIDFLRSKVSIEAILFSRLKAIRAGEKTMEECSLNYDQNELSEAERLRYLWSNDRFRNTMQRAAVLSNEPHLWNSYNFACAPKNAEHLQHKMLTAEDRITGEIVGFCEIAMLLHPCKRESHDERQHDCHGGDVVRPTIVNLVVSPRYRRRGIASRIIRSAFNYVTREWEAEDLNLYVAMDNRPAIALYKSMGFEKTSDSQLPGHEAYWYMSRSVHSSARSKDIGYSQPKLQLVN